jgi:hypothetical protein
VGLIQLVVLLLVVGVLLWLVETAPFVSVSIKPIIRWVIIAAVVLWLLSVFFGIGDIQIPSLGRR